MTFPKGPYQDFLGTPPATVQGDNPTEWTALLAEQTNVLRDIRSSLLKQNPEVQCQTIIQNSGIDELTITDALQHKVYFETGGKQRTIYQITAWSNYTATIYLGLNSMSHWLDGIPIIAGNTLIFPCNVEAVYLWVPTLPADLHINGNADHTAGGFALYGWTIPEYESHYR